MTTAGGVSARSSREEWRRHWPLVAATAAGMSLAALLSAIFGVMLGPIEQEFGWSRAEISSGPAVVSIMGLFLATPAGFAIDRLGARRCGILVVLISCTAIASMSAIGGSLWHWWAAWGLFGISGAFTSTVWLAPVSTIFHAGRGMAIALTISGTGISMALAPGIAEYFVQNQGWRSGFLALAGIWFVMTMPLVLAFVPKADPSRRDERPVEEERSAVPATATGLTPRQGFASRSFYLLFAASLVSAMTGVALVLNLVPVLTFTGLTRIDAVAIAGSMGLASIFGRIVGGWLMDRYDVRRLAIYAALASLAFPLTLLFLPGVLWAAYLGVIAYGLTGGMKMNAIVYLTSTHLGARSFGLFYGTISITTTVAQGIGPLAANHIYDLTQSYTPVMWAAIPGFLGAALLFAALGPEPDLSGRPASR
jgi:MFS family permease